MKKLLALLILSTSYVYGQRNLTIDETVYGPNKYSPKTILAPKWIPNSNAISSIDSTFENLEVRNNKHEWLPSVLITKVDLQNALDNTIKGDKIEIDTFPTNYTWIDENTISLAVDGEETRYNVSYEVRTKKAKIQSSLPLAVATKENKASTTKTAFLNGNNIEILAFDGQKIRVTNDTTDGVVNGAAVHRNEFGISEGMWWSPDEQSLLYYTKHEGDVSKYPLPQWDSRVATTKEIRYPMAGMASEIVTLTVYDTKEKRYTQIQTGEPNDQYLTMVTWDPNSNYVYIGLLSRGQDHLQVNKYDAKTGELIATLFEERSSTWVEPQHGLAFLPNNPNQFIYQTDRDGFNQLYLYDTNGKLIQKLGYNNIVVVEFHGFSRNGTKAYYQGATNNGLDRHLFEVELKSGETSQLTNSPGIHQASISDDGQYVLDQYSNLTTPNKIQIIKRKNQETTPLLNANNPLQGKINLPKIEFTSLTSKDGNTPLNARITYPTNFDKNKKYPVIVYLYGGSHAQLVTNRWLGGANYFDLYMAQNGYLVFTIDNRGSDARDRDFTRVTHRNLGEKEMEDQLVGINYLKSLPYVDQDNLGIFGWSFGGFMTCSMMTKENTIFKAAVAGGPVIDWKYYEIMYGERYMDTPEENPVGYEKASLLNKADKLNGHLLIIHGAQDPVVVQQHSMQFIQKCIEAGKQVDYFLYPTHEHNVLGRDRIHMYDKIAKYFNLYLKSQS